LVNQSKNLWCLGEEEVSAGALSRDVHAAQDTSSQHLQHVDAVDNFRQSYLSSGKFNFSLITY